MITIILAQLHFSCSRTPLAFLAALLTVATLLMASPTMAQPDAQASNVSPAIRAMIEQAQSGSQYDSMARMQVDVQFGEFLSTLADDPDQRMVVEQALIDVISERAELSAEVATGRGDVAELEALSSYAYLRGQLAPLLDSDSLQLLDEQQGAIAERNLRLNYGEQLTREAPDLSDANREMVLDILVPAMLFQQDEADDRNQLTPDQIVNQQLMSLRDAREALQSRLNGPQLEQVEQFFNQIRSNLFLNQSMYDASQ